FLMEYEHMSFPEAVAELARRAGLPLPETGFEPGGRADSTPLLAVLEEAARFYREQLRRSERAVAYLNARGVSGEEPAAFGRGYAPAGRDARARPLGGSPVAREALVQAALAVRREADR